MKKILDNKVIGEMISSEEKYNETLGLLKNLFNERLLFDKNPSLQKLPHVLNLLKQISDDLIKNVNRGINSTTDENRAIYRSQRMHLLKDFFSAYLRYVETYQEFMTSNKDNRELFSKYDQMLSEKSGHTQGLGFLLIQPIQRAPRYLLLIEEAKKSGTGLDEKNMDELACLAENARQMLLGFKTSAAPVSVTPTVVSDEPSYGYRFGDGSRFLARTFFGKPEPIPATKKEPAPDNDLCEDDFYLMEKDKDDDDKEQASPSSSSSLSLP